MAKTSVAARLTAPPDEETLAATTVALEEHGFSVEVVDDLDAARHAVLARIPNGASVMTNTSVTLDETGIAEAINDGGPYESARNKMMALDYATQLPEMKAVAGEAEYALGSVHAVTRDGTALVPLGSTWTRPKVARESTSRACLAAASAVIASGRTSSSGPSSRTCISGTSA